MIKNESDRKKIEEWVERSRDFEIFAPMYLKIKDEYGNIILLKFNYAQRKVLGIIKKRQSEDKPIRLIILKARQMGISTLIQGWCFHYEITHSNQKMLTMGHKVDASNNLYDMYQRYYQQLPKELQPIIGKSNEKKIIFKKLGSENKIDTAQTGSGANEEGTGRSDTYQILHLTEVAFYPDAKTTLKGLLQGSKYAKAIFIESTANGIGDTFYNMWKDAIDGVSDYIPIFIGWLEFPTYTKPFENEEQRERLINDLGNGLFNEYADEEKILLEKHGATLEQLNWRRWAIKNLCNNSVSDFHSEYPSTHEEAFVATGRPVFPSNICQQNKIESLNLVRDRKKPLYTGDLIIKYDNDIKKVLEKEGKTDFEDLRFAVEGVEFVESQRGFIKIWTPIKKNGYYRFIAGVDVSEGLEQGDRSTIRVMDRETGEVCLTWSGMIDPDLFSEEIYKIWWFLGKDIHFGIERNNHGLTVINKCFKLGVDLYYQENFSKGYVAQSSKIGWQTNVKTKPFMINELNTWIREGLFKDYEPEFWDECLTFVKNARGQMQAEGKDSDPGSKCFDDRVIAQAIMLRVHEWLPNFIKENTEDKSIARHVNLTTQVGDYTF